MGSFDSANALRFAQRVTSLRMTAAISDGFREVPVWSTIWLQHAPHFLNDGPGQRPGPNTVPAQS